MGQILGDFRIWITFLDLKLIFEVLTSSVSALTVFCPDTNTQICTASGQKRKKVQRRLCQLRELKNCI
jgi:hypothetical protein